MASQKINFILRIGVQQNMISDFFLKRGVNTFFILFIRVVHAQKQQSELCSRWGSGRFHMVEFTSHIDVTYQCLPVGLYSGHLVYEGTCLPSTNCTCSSRDKILALCWFIRNLVQEDIKLEFEVL